MRLSVVPRVTTGCELPITVVTTSATVLAMTSCSGGPSGSSVLGAVLSEPSEGVDRVIQRPGISGGRSYRCEGPLPPTPASPAPALLTHSGTSSPGPAPRPGLRCPAITHGPEVRDCVYES